MMYFLVKYEFKVKSKNNNEIILHCAEVMDENKRHYALEYIDDADVWSVKADIGDDEFEEIWVDIDEVRDAIESSMDISKEEYNAFQRMFEGSQYGQLGWEDLEVLIDEEREFEEDEDEEDEWEAAARECW